MTAAETVAAAPAEAGVPDFQEARLARDAIRMAAFGHACWLMGRSGVHRHMFFADADWLIMPPIILNQYRLWVRNGLPVGYASWGLLGPEAADRMAGGVRRLSPGEWKSGESIWLVDFVAPFGGDAEMIAELKSQVFSGKTVKTLRADPVGGITAAVL